MIFSLEGNILNEKGKRNFQEVSGRMENSIAAASLKNLSGYEAHIMGKDHHPPG